MSCGFFRCRCGLVFDFYGDYRVVCVIIGVFRVRVVFIERAVVRICREVGVRVAVNVSFSRMNFAVSVIDVR